MTTAQFKHISPPSVGAPKPWAKVDCPASSFTEQWHTRHVSDIRGQEKEFSTDNAGFTVLTYPSPAIDFSNDQQVRSTYYQSVEQLLRETYKGIKRIEIFDHTIRKRVPNAPRQPVQQVHVDQTPEAVVARVRRHITDPEEAATLLKGRYQLTNVWRPISHSASDFPLAVIDWRTTSPSDFIAVDLLYPKRDSLDTDDRGKEKLPPPEAMNSTEGYEARGEILGVAPSEKHRFWYMKDMRPDEVMLLKCFDSWGEGMEGGKEGIAVRTPHTAFEDPATPAGAPPRESIEVRCLIFYEG